MFNIGIKIGYLIQLFHDRIGHMKRLVPDEIILGILKYQPTHGYELIERFRSQAQLGRVWTMSSSQIYAVLKRLDEQDAIVGREINNKDAPARTEYHVTALGYEQLKSWLYEPQPSSSIHHIRVEFISRLYVASLLHHPCDAIFDHQIRVCEAQIDKTSEDMINSASGQENMTLHFVLGQLEAAINWLQFYRSEFVDKHTTGSYQSAHFET